MRNLRPCRSSTVFDLLAEPAAGLDAAGAGIEADHAEAVIDLAPELAAIAVVDPRRQLRCGQAERHAGEPVQRRGLAGPVVRRAVCDLDGTALHRIEAAERRHQLAGGEQLDLQPAARHRADPLRELLGRDTDTRRQPRPRHHHVPACERPARSPVRPSPHWRRCRQPAAPVVCIAHPLAHWFRPSAAAVGRPGARSIRCRNEPATWPLRQPCVAQVAAAGTAGVEQRRARRARARGHSGTRGRESRHPAGRAGRGSSSSIWR